jgi:hypothetical protein
MGWCPVQITMPDADNFEMNSDLEQAKEEQITK